MELRQLEAFVAVARFVHTALTSDLPPGWHTQPGHLRYHPGPAVT